jgi:GNAT superfamily N-acetyltransferase
MNSAMIPWRLDHIGIRIVPFVTVLEGQSAIDSSLLNDNFQFCSLTENNFDDLILIEPHYTKEKIVAWFDAGKLCFGLRDGERLVAKMWCDLNDMFWEPAFRKLKKEEAYLFAAYSDPEYRGKNLAATLRGACYEYLRDSHSEYFNLPARRFKQKLGGIETDLQIEFGLFRKWNWIVMVRRY